MLRPVRTPIRDFSAYAEVVRPALIDEIEGLASRLQGASVLHLSSTADGGGVAEILRSLVPLYRSVGLESEWMVMEAPNRFFRVTKKLHDGLQGASIQVSAAEWRDYERTNAELANHLDGREWDFVLVHDPQPAAVLHTGARRGDAQWVWRCHIDCSRPDPTIAARVRTYVASFDGHVFSRRSYAFNGLRPRLFVIPPAIDPLSAKNVPVTEAEARSIVASLGIDPDRPLVVQVSRFDAWKDQPGVIEAWSIARRRQRRVQLALVGSSADDDPNSQSVLRQVRRRAARHADIHVLADRLGDREVKAVLTHADIAMQKSLREGFGLTVSEALWTGTPVIGGDVGGIPLQLRHGRDGYLVRSPQEAARRIVQLLRAPALRRRMGESGRRHVRSKFLLPRLLRDELKMWATLRARRRGQP